MSLNNPFAELKNILQDTIMKIPFFISHTQTNILAMPFEEKIMNQIQQNSQIIGSQVKLYYSSQKAIKTIILQFNTIDQAKKFKIKHDSKENKDSEDIVNRFNQPLLLGNEQQQIFKANIFYCLDISFLDGILYQCGRISVITPSSKTLLSIINNISKMIVVQGVGLEEQLKNLAYKEEYLQFLDHKLISSENFYYRWRVYSYLQGDRDKNYRTEPFQIVENGAYWHPPPLIDKYKSKILQLDERVYFANLLQNLTLHKRKIQQIMVFCIFNSDAAVDICSIITVTIGECLLKDIVSEDKFLQYFYLLSDIFFNSQTAIYRDIMGVILPNLLQMIHEKVSNLDKFKELMDIWKKKFVFEEDYFRGLEWILEKKTAKLSSKIASQISIKNEAEIQAMCFSHGLTYFYQNQQRNIDSLILMLSNSEIDLNEEIEPNFGEYDGQQLSEKDILKIKNKQCKAVTCEGTNVRWLFEKSSQKHSLSIDKEKQ